jgi:cysteinyl-tRNA synthetase
MYSGMNNDFNTAQTLAAMNEISNLVNTWANQGKNKADISQDTLSRIQSEYQTFITDIFGLKAEENTEHDTLDGIMELVLDIRKRARANRDFETSDKIRDVLQSAGIIVKDSKEGSTWEQA